MNVLQTTDQERTGQAGAADDRPRVLHILRTLRFGGIETWLVHLLRHRDTSVVRHEVLIMVDEVGPYEPELVAMGIPIHKLVMDGGWPAWLARLRRFLVSQGPFDAVQSHASVVGTAAIVAAAAAAGVPVRIAHSHEARHAGADFTLARRLKRAVSLAAIRLFSTRRIGISDSAMAEISGARWDRDAGSSILLYGFDFSANDGAADRAAAIREKLDIPAESTIVGHVGRFAPVKNHDFILRTFAAALQLRSDLCLVLVGIGDLQDSARQQAKALGIEGNVRFAGSTSDVPAYMALFDIFLFPSFSEGLGIVVLEAQAAGTPTLMTDSLPDEVVVVPGGVERLPLSAGPDAWAKRLLDMLGREPAPPGEWRRTVEASRFGMRRCVDDLNLIYVDEFGGRRQGPATE